MLGTCEELCPPHEAKWRIKEKLLHFFEYKDGDKHVPGILVKSFARSAAGTKAPTPKNLRTEDCLYRTIEYLLKDILLDERRPFHFIYDFIFDRLRAVRQETVIQNFDGIQCVRILVPIIMFLAYSRYRLCEEPIENFDPLICDQHLQECLKRALVAYDQMGVSKLSKQHFKNRIFVESLYQAYNLGSVDALSRYLQLPVELKENNQLIQTVFKTSLNYYQGNIYRVIQNICTFPHIICAIAALRMQSLRRMLYESFSHAYNNKQLSVPMEFVRSIAKQNKNEFIKDCKYFNLKISKDLDAIHFLKLEFNTTAQALPARHETFVELKFKNFYLPDILLLKNSTYCSDFDLVGERA